MLSGREWRRRGDSDTVAVGSDGMLDHVTGHEELEVHGNLREKTNSTRTTALSGLDVVVDGSLTMKGFSDTTLLGGGIRETHIGVESVVAGLSDDMIVGLGNRSTYLADVWMGGLIGSDELMATCVNDLILTEIAGTFFDREYTAGMHLVTGTVTWKGVMYNTFAASFKQYLKATWGIRNTVQGGNPNAAQNPPPSPPPVPNPELAAAVVQGAGQGAAGTAEVVNGPQHHPAGDHGWRGGERRDDGAGHRGDGQLPARRLGEPAAEHRRALAGAEPAAGFGACAGAEPDADDRHRRGRGSHVRVDRRGAGRAQRVERRGPAGR